MRDLLVNAQRVNRHWNGVIKTSPTLQQKLFFKSRARKSPKDKPEFNPLLEALFPPFFDLEAFSDYKAMHNRFSIVKMQWEGNFEACSKMLDPKATWRNMFAVQPAAKLSMVVRRLHMPFTRRKEFSEVVGTIGNPLHRNDPQTMGMIYDLVHGTGVDQYFKLSFYARWHMFKMQEVLKGSTADPESYKNSLEFTLAHGGQEVKDEISIYAYEVTPDSENLLDEIVALRSRPIGTWTPLKDRTFSCKSHSSSSLGTSRYHVS
jgi:hypothetical protein